MIENIDHDKCTGCGICAEVCPLDTVRVDPFQKEVPPCQYSCPAMVDIRGYIYFLKNRMPWEASPILGDYLPYPAITGRLCHHPCELKCARKAIDEAVDINGLERYVGDNMLLKGPEFQPRIHAGENDTSGLALGEVELLKNRIYEPLGKPGIPYKEVLREVQEAFFPYDVCILKNEKSLTRALQKIETVKRELLPGMGAQDPHYLMKYFEVQSITRITELILRASLMRTESRAGHFRADYPDRNNDEWLCWNVATLDIDGEYTFQKKPVPIDQYEIKPTRFYSENFTFPDVSNLIN